MSTIINLDRKVNEELAADIEKESVFVSPYLNRLSVRPDGTAVEFEISDAGREAEVAPKVQRYLEAMLQRTHNFDTKVFLKNRRKDAGPYTTAVHEELKARGWLHDYNKGYVAISGPVLNLARLVDAKAGELYEAHFGAAAGQYPAFIDAETLAKCGYFDSHPNAVSFVGHMVEDFDAIEDFRRANSCAEGWTMPQDAHVHMPGQCLNPAACFPCYPTLEGRRIDGDGTAFTWMGRVFRYESKNISGLDRLWEFNVRELVFVGTEDYVKDCRRRALPLIGELAAAIDVDCSIETASDPFFATVAAAKKFWQQAQEVKNEIMLPVEPGPDGAERRLACGSINLHGNFFGTRFDIEGSDGQPAFTGCIGLGIERWVLAGFVQHGFDPSRWPHGIREKVFG